MNLRDYQGLRCPKNIQISTIFVGRVWIILANIFTESDVEFKNKSISVFFEILAYFFGPRQYFGV